MWFHVLSKCPFILACRIPFSISCKAGSVVNSFHFLIVQKCLYLSLISEGLLFWVKYSWLVLIFIVWINHPLSSGFPDFCWGIHWQPYGCSLLWDEFLVPGSFQEFSLSLIFFSLSLNFDNFIILCLSEVFFGFSLTGDFKLHIPRFSYISQFGEFFSYCFFSKYSAHFSLLLLWLP